MIEQITKAKKFKEEKHRIENKGSASNLYNNSQTNRNVKSYSTINSKINQIYLLCSKSKISKIDEIIMKFHDSLKRNSSTTNEIGLQNNKKADLEMLTIIEKIIEYLKNSFDDVQNTRKDDLKMIQFELEEERVKKKSRDAKKEELRRTERLKEIILQKMNKLYIIPGRKVTGRYKLFEKVKKMTRGFESRENCNLQELLNYEDNEF